MDKKLFLELYNIKDERILRDIDISKYNLKKINSICPPEDEGDFEYCNGYFIEKKEFNLLKKYIIELRKYNYENYIYNLITRQLLPGQKW